LSIEDDKQMAQRFPVLHLILGGHDHQHMEFKVGNTVITKADANAKTVYIHRITHDWKKQKTFIESALKKIDDKIPHDPDTEAIVQKWLTFAYGKLESSGYRPREVIYRTDEKLDGLEYSVRHRATNLTKLIIEAAKSVFPQADGVILNGGAIRLDDILTGEITQEDILRTMPFGDGLVLVRVQGDILLKTLEIGSTLNIGTGGFLHHGNIEKQDNQWCIAGKPISETQTYLITTSRFLSSGKERNLDFFNFPDAYCPEKIGEIRNDVRDILIHFLKSKKI
ncbi:MAG: 5'-nucleotidase C-terminal domain-containing protein, partial [Flammeovirgaceae bacterium]|nr:5'-nucleotidase C-terminal domain-containing protein [Flammeovirgaceae bacterium]MDW8288226.1 5'-nucleotidase C-terminal domain-containing protein [Flammeovirgaceae bacterium]